MNNRKQHLSETYARLFKGKPASNDRKLLREFNENGDSPFSRDGRNDNMKASEFRKLIREEIQNVLTEAYARASKEGKALDKYFEELVPAMGKADTVNGEIVRAVTRIGYRWYNDGDKFFEGYGAETAGPAMAYLTQSTSIDPQIRAAFSRAESKAQGGPDSIYETFLQELFELAVRHVETIPDKPNTDDMLKYESRYEDYEDNGDWDDEDNGDWDDDY